MGKGKEVRFLIVGDSLTDHSVYPEHILTLYKAVPVRSKYSADEKTVDLKQVEASSVTDFRTKLSLSQPS